MAKESDKIESRIKKWVKEILNALIAAVALEFVLIWCRVHITNNESIVISITFAVLIAILLFVEKWPSSSTANPTPTPAGKARGKINFLIPFVLGLACAILIYISLIGPHFYRIKIISAPTATPGTLAVNPITGVVSGGDSQEYSNLKVIVFVQSPGNPAGDWYIQPSTGSSSDVDRNGNWECQTHGGILFKAFLAKPSYSPPQNSPISLNNLPELGGDILAADTKQP